MPEGFASCICHTLTFINVVHPMDPQVKLVPSEEKDISEIIEEKGKDLKKILKEMDAKIEHWKFSMEETKEGRRVEVHITALFKSKPKKDE